MTAFTQWLTPCYSFKVACSFLCSECSALNIYSWCVRVRQLIIIFYCVICMGSSSGSVKPRLLVYALTSQCVASVRCVGALRRCVASVRCVSALHQRVDYTKPNAHDIRFCMWWGTELPFVPWKRLELGFVWLLSAAADVIWSNSVDLIVDFIYNRPTEPTTH
jgi:hypothetical protein